MDHIEIVLLSFFRTRRYRNVILEDISDKAPYLRLVMK